MNKVVLVFLLVLFFVTGVEAEEADLGTIVVTATRIAQRDYRTTGNVTVITRADIKDSGVQSIPDILKQKLGIFVYNKGTVKTSTVDIRGFGDTSNQNVLVLVNDRKINSIDNSGADIFQIPLEAVEQIEIVRGAGSVLYGDNAAGGVINIITKKGRGPLQMSAALKYGSYNRRSTQMETLGSYEGWNYFFSGKYNDEKGFRENSDVLSHDFNARFGYEEGEKWGVDFDMGRHEDNYRMPSGLDEVELAANGRRASMTPNDYATSRDSHYKASLNITPWPEDLEYGHFVIDYSYRDREAFDSTYWLGSTYDTTRKLDTHGVTVKYIFDRNFLNRDLNFVVGLDYYKTDNDIKGSSGDVLIEKEEIGGYASSQYELFKDVYALVGTRYQQSEYKFNNRTLSNVSGKRPDEWVSMGGLQWEYTEKSTAHLNVQQTFRFLSTDEWYSAFSGLNDTLKHQKGTQYEVGVQHSLNDYLNVSLTPYVIDNKDEIFYDPAAGLWGSNSNYDKTRRQGVEVGSEFDLDRFFDFEFFNDLKISANYTYQKARFSEGTYEGRYIPLVPRHQIGLGLTGRIFKQVQMSLNTRYVGQRYIINDLDNAMGQASSYWVTDIKFSYENENIETFVELNNLVNEQYSTYDIKKTSTTRDIYPAEDRNIMVGMKVKF